MKNLQEFATYLESETLRGLIRHGVDCEPNRQNAKTHIHIGKKYARVDVGGSGKYMVELSTGIIYGIKAYGVIHRGYAYGTLDTFREWDWSGYGGAIRKENI